MKLAIADPPYLGRANTWYGTGKGLGRGVYRADCHPGAYEWDTPERHRHLISFIVDTFDGWAIASSHGMQSIRTYAAAVPEGTRMAVWSRTNAMPGGNRITPSFEPVWVYVPECRRGRGTGLQTRDNIQTPIPTGMNFAGSKPPSWTRWVLDMLGYDAETDTIDDIFGGSGAVSREIAQGVFDFGEGA